MNLFGNNNALIGSIDLIFGAVFVLGAFIFRKTVANDMMARGFSLLGSTIPGILAYLVASSFLSSLKYSVGIGLIFWAVGGFLLAEILNDGWADGGPSG